MRPTQFRTYREVIRYLINQSSSIRGYQGQLAEIAQCQQSYFSNVLGGKANLGLEQAMRLALFWKFSEEETDYFLELVTLERTQFPPLRKRIEERLQKMRREADNLATRFSKTHALPLHQEAFYYSSWIASAVHILVGIPGFQSATAVAQRLSLSPALVQEFLTKLEKMGLVRCQGKKWEAVPGHFHLSKGSPFTSMNHQNWRHQAIVDAQSPSATGVHYTCVQSHSVADFMRIKDELLKFLDSTRTVVEGSPNEEMSCLCVDFFRVG